MVSVRVRTLKGVVLSFGNSSLVLRKDYIELQLCDIPGSWNFIVTCFVFMNSRVLLVVAI